MKWPGKIPPNKRITDPVNLLDVTATMLAAAGVEMDHPLTPVGEDLMPLVNSSTSREQMICDHFGHSGDVCFQKILSVNGWKYVSAYSAGDELYDLNSDPYELANRIDDESTFDRQCKMRALIIKHYEQRRTERERWHPQEFWDKGIVYSSVVNDFASSARFLWRWTSSEDCSMIPSLTAAKDTDNTVCMAVA